MRLLILCLMLCACDDTPSKPQDNTIITPNGKRGAAVDCGSGLGGENRNECYIKISKVCTKGYTIIEDKDNGQMMVECKE